MNKAFLLKNGFVVAENGIAKTNILIDNQRIKSISNSVPCINKSSYETIDLEGLYVFPGIIDTHVHFREPGLTGKATFAHESAAAIAGGITSVIEMPNTIPFANSLTRIQEKKQLSKENSLVNAGFFIGADKDNINELTHLTNSEVAGIKVFMGSSTGNVVIQDENSLALLFSQSKLPIVVHAEDDEIIKQNLDKYKAIYNNNIPFKEHPEIRSTEACLSATKRVLKLAKEYGTNLHVLHISSADEIELFDTTAYPNITAEVCLPHLWFCDKDYENLKGKIKCNPAIKSIKDRETLRNAINTDKVFSIGTDHAPHTSDEKNKPYLECPSGIPFIQHSLIAMLELYHKGYITLENIANKMAHNPAIRFHIKERGFIKPGYFADLTVVDLNSPHTITLNNLLYKCQWSPLMGESFTSKVVYTFVNGNPVFNNGKILMNDKGMLLEYS